MEIRDWLNVVALIVVLIGFSITITNTLRSRSAAEHARDAVAKMREDMKRIDTVAEITLAISRLEEIRRLQRQGMWAILPDRYSEVLKSLISIRSSGYGFSTGQRTALQKATKTCKDVQGKIELAICANDAPRDIAKWNRAVSLHVEALHELLAQIKNELGR